LYHLAKERHIFFCNWTVVQHLGLLDPEDQGTMIVSNVGKPFVAHDITEDSHPEHIVD